MQKNILYLLFFVIIVGATNCTSNNFYQKNVIIPEQKWNSNFKPTFSFTITDTSAIYKIYFVLRHTAQYNYNNIWMDVDVKIPNEKWQQFRVEKKIADNDKGFFLTGVAMNDVYEHRIPLTINAFHFTKIGTYTFSFNQIMREDPLNYVLSVGLRVEKI